MTYERGAAWCAKRNRHHWITGCSTCTTCGETRSQVEVGAAADREDAMRDLYSDTEQDLRSHREER